MKKKLRTKKSKKYTTINIHMYGIFDEKKNKMVKVSLDVLEIQMELALSDGLGEDLVECEFDVRLSL